jgi:hypothetical protein
VVGAQKHVMRFFTLLVLTLLGKAKAELGLDVNGLVIILHQNGSSKRSYLLKNKLPAAIFLQLDG